MKLRKILKKLDKYENVAFDNENAFLNKFAKGDAFMLVGIRFCNCNVIDILYILECGQHVVDGIKLKKFLKFYKEYK